MTALRRASYVSVRRASYVSARVFGIGVLALVVSAHVGSPDVFFSGRAGPYDVRVIVSPPQVVPGVARVIVHAPPDVRRVLIHPVFWRAGSRGAPAADEMRRAESARPMFEGSLWLMARGAYSVDVTVEGVRGRAHVLVPVASVATGRLSLSPMLGVLLVALGGVLVAGLVTIVYKGAGESLVEAKGELAPVARRGARLAAAVSIAVIAVALLGGARWWRAVDRDYERRIFRPMPRTLSLDGRVLRLPIRDILLETSGSRFPLIRDHGKLMHLFLVRADDARAFAHLHPELSDDSAGGTLVTTVPPLPAGTYRAYGDVVDETGFERTVVRSLVLADSGAASATRSHAGADADDAWFVGDATRDRTMRLSDGSSMQLEIVPNGEIQAGREESIRVQVLDPSGKPARLEPYLGMTAHAVVVRADGAVYVHLHPMGTITNAAQEAFAARDRGDTTAEGRLRLGMHDMQAMASASSASSATEFPYAFPRSGSYRLFVQVKRNGRVLTGAFAISVADSAEAR